MFYLPSNLSMHKYLFLAFIVIHDKTKVNYKNNNVKQILKNLQNPENHKAKLA